MRIILCGYDGHMSREVRTCAEAAEGCEIVAGVDPMIPENEGICAKTFGECTAEADVIIDFSHHCMTGDLLGFAERRKLPVVLATTGQTEEEKARIREAAKKIPIFLAANYSLGIATLTDLVKRAVALYPDGEIEIVEQHHDRKIDAPSGTALALAEALRQVRPKAFNVLGRHGAGKRTKDEIGIHSLRMGNLAGEHEVILATPYQTLTLKHEAHSRALFAEGAVAAARFLCGKPAGLYTMNDLISI
jgi:4-hydroxy-tetrahydrodipicolinate reductase